MAPANSDEIVANLSRSVGVCGDVGGAEAAAATHDGGAVPYTNNTQALEALDAVHALVDRAEPPPSA